MDDRAEFTDHQQVHDHAKAHGLEYAWEGTAQFARRKRQLAPDQYELRPVRTKRGVTVVMLYSRAITRAEWEADAPRREALAAKRAERRARGLWW